MARRSRPLTLTAAVLLAPLGVRGVRCETTSGTRSCHTGTFTVGEVITDVLSRGGTVRRVSIGRVFD